jgi:hypothetical protein
METNGHPDLQSLVGSIRGLRCWYVSTGGAVGSTFQLALGSKVRRERPLQNPTHSEEYRQFEGEANLLVWCAWRLDGPTAPLTSWDDAEAAVRAGLGNLIGAMVEAVEVVAPGFDLTLRFSGNWTLRVFPDHVPGDPSFDGNWELWLQQTAVFCGPGARCEIEPRSESAQSTVPTSE